MYFKLKFKEAVTQNKNTWTDVVVSLYTLRLFKPIKRKGHLGNWPDGKCDPCGEAGSSAALQVHLQPVALCCMSS